MESIEPIRSTKTFTPVERTLGCTSTGRPIECLQVTEGPVNLLLIGGVHGDEPEGYYLVERYLDEQFYENLHGKASLYIIPRLNPDGCASAERTNSRGVDLNRNMPTKDWNQEARAPRYYPGKDAGSEAETQILIKFIEEIEPHAIITAHSWNPMINYNGPCKKLAEHMAKFNGYIIADDIGYPTPGSLGTWAGWERKIPTITLEIQKDSTEEEVWKTHGAALKEALLFAAENKDLG